MKPLLSSLREKKRYVAFKAITTEPLAFKSIRKSIQEHFLNLAGEKGYAKAGIMILPEQWDKNKHLGILKVNHLWLYDLKMALALVKNIDGEKVILQSIGVSGILDKAKQYR